MANNLTAAADRPSPSPGGEGAGGEVETGADLLARIRAEKAELIRQGKLRKEKPLPPITDAEKPFDLPEGWVWCRLGEIALVSEYGTSEKADLNSNNVPVFRMGNIQKGQIIALDLKYVKSSIPDLPKLYLKHGVGCISELPLKS